MTHLWMLNKWKEYIAPDTRKGLRMRFDANVDPEVRRAYKEFAKFLRREYYFPIRVTIYVKSTYRINAMDGEEVCGTFWYVEDDRTIEPHIRLAAGDYFDLCQADGDVSALTSLLLSMAHELTHYFQWINGIISSTIGLERQANNYAHRIIHEYAETRERP